MTIIRADPLLLRSSSSKIDGAGRDAAATGGDLLHHGLAAPSYEGQFGPRVAAVGREADARAKALADRLSYLSGRLHAKADEFEAADLASLGPLGTFLKSLGEWFSGARAIQVLSELFGLPIGSIQRYLRLGGLLDPRDSGLRTGLLAAFVPPLGLLVWLGRSFESKSLLPYWLSPASVGSRFANLIAGKGWHSGMDIVDRRSEHSDRKHVDSLNELRAREDQRQRDVIKYSPVPFVSQWDPVIGSGRANCGPASVAMAMEKYEKETSIYEVAEAMRGKGKAFAGGFTNFRSDTTQALLSDKDLRLEDVGNLTDLQEQVGEGHPVVMLVDNSHFVRWENGRQVPYPGTSGFVGGAHIIVVTGHDEAYFYINDPLAVKSEGGKYVADPEGGTNFAVPIEDFKRAAEAYGWYGSAIVPK